jgi:hypothetical protein
MERWFYWLNAWAKKEHEKQLKEQVKMKDNETVGASHDGAPAVNYRPEDQPCCTSRGGPYQLLGENLQARWGSLQADEYARICAGKPLLTPEEKAVRETEKIIAQRRILEEHEQLERAREESLKKDIKGVKCVTTAVSFGYRPHEEGGDVNSSSLMITLRRDRHLNWGCEGPEPVYTLTVNNSLESDDHQHHHQQLVCTKLTHSEKEDLVRMLSSI